MGPVQPPPPDPGTLGLGKIGLITWTLMGGGFGCLSSPSPPGCLDYASRVVATSSQRIYDYPVAKHTVDARSVDWVGQVLDAVKLEGSGSGCFVGGRIEGTWDPADSWDLYHDRFGFFITVEQTPITIEGVHVLNTGDAVSLKPTVPCPNGSPTWMYVRGSHVEDIHDDAIESDGLCSVDIRDNLLDRVYVAFAFRNRIADPRSGSGNTVTVVDNLIRMQAFQNNFMGQTTHGGLWKWARGGRGPKVVVRGNRILAFDAPEAGMLLPFVTRVQACEDNVLLFAGSEAEWQQALLGGCDHGDEDDGLCDGERLLALADCFTVTTRPDTQSEADFLAAHWDPHVADWKTAHSADDE